MQTIRKRLFKVLTANIFGQVSNIIIQIISIPIFVKFWGIKLYGEWLLLSTIPAYLSISDMGFFNVAANEMTMQVAESNKSKALETYQSTWIFISHICFLLMMLISLFWFLPFKKWLNIYLLTNYQVALILTLLSVSVVVSLQGSLLSAGYRCDGNYALGTWIGNLSKLGEVISVLVGIYFGIGLVEAAIILLVVRSLSFIISWLILHKISPWIVFGYHLANLGKIKQMVLPSLAFMAFTAGYAIKNQGMLTIVGIMLGPTSVVTFSTLRTLLNSASQAMGLTNNTIWPEMSMAYGSGNMALARNLHRHSCQISFWVSLCAIITLAFVGEWIIRIWTLGKVAMDPLFFHWMLMVIFVNSLWFTSSVVPAALNKHERMAFYFITGTVLSVLLAVILVPTWGLSGIAFASLVMEIIMASYVITASLKILDERFASFFLVVITPPYKLLKNIKWQTNKNHHPL